MIKSTRFTKKKHYKLLIGLLK